MIKFLVVLCLFVYGKDYFDLDLDEAVQITPGGSAKFRISINISSGLTYIPAHLGSNIHIDNLLGTLEPGSASVDYQYFTITSSIYTKPGESFKFNLIQTQGSHLSGHNIRQVNVHIIPS